MSSSEHSKSSFHTCVFCCEEMVSDFAAMPCGHVFHFNCLRDLHTASTNEPTDQERMRGVTRTKFLCPLRCTTVKSISMRDILRLHIQLESSSGDNCISGTGKTQSTIDKDEETLDENGLRLLVKSLQTRLEKLKADSERQISEIEEERDEAEDALSFTKDELADTTRRFEEAKSRIKEQDSLLEIRLIKQKNVERCMVDLNDHRKKLLEENKFFKDRMSAVDFATTGFLDTLESERSKNISRRLNEGSIEVSPNEHEAWRKGFKACEKEERATFYGMQTRLSKIEEERDIAIEAQRVTERELRMTQLKFTEDNAERNKLNKSLSEKISTLKLKDASFNSLQEKYNELKRQMSVSGVASKPSLTGIGTSQLMTTTTKVLPKSPIDTGSIGGRSSSILGLMNQEKTTGSLLFSKPIGSQTSLIAPMKSLLENSSQRATFPQKAPSIQPFSKPSGIGISSQSTLSWGVSSLAPKSAAIMAPNPLFKATQSQIIDLADDDDDEDEERVENIQLQHYQQQHYQKQQQQQQQQQQITKKRSLTEHFDTNARDDTTAIAIKKKSSSAIVQTKLNSWALGRGDSLRTTNSE